MLNDIRFLDQRDDAHEATAAETAKSLGSLGDEQWADVLVLATRHPTNVDLRVCATLALGQLQSPATVNALIDVYQHDGACPAALDALSRIADASSVAFLRSVGEHPKNQVERTMARQALERIQIMQQADPVAALLQRVQDIAQQGALDTWAVRKLVAFDDVRTIAILREILLDKENGKEDDRITLAAALLAHDEAGVAALKSLAGADSEPHTNVFAVAHAALALLGPTNLRLASY